MITIGCCTHCKQPLIFSDQNIIDPYLTQLFRTLNKIYSPSESLAIVEHLLKLYSHPRGIQQNLYHFPEIRQLQITDPPLCCTITSFQSNSANP